MKKISTKFLVTAGIIAAAYAVLTLLLSPISYGVMQVRISEAMISLCIFTPAAIPGLAIGCFLSGILGPNGIVDALLGTVATLIGAWGTYRLRKHKYIAPIVNVISNGVIVGAMLHYVYGVEIPLIYCILWVSLGEFISCIVLGAAVTKYLSSRKTDIVSDVN